MTKKIDEYTQVLQAVGNSILNQADELQARETHDLSLKDGADRARYGASRILDRTPQQTVAAVIDQFEAERIDASNSLKAANVKIEKTNTELRDAAKKLDPYIDQDLQPADESKPLPKPTDLTDKANEGPLKDREQVLSDAEDTLCRAFTSHAINMISAHLTLTSENDQALYNDIHSHKPSKPCQALGEVQELLKRHRRLQDLAPAVQPYAKRVQTEIENWKPKDKVGNDLPQNAPAVRDRIAGFLNKLQKEITDLKDPDYIRLKKVSDYLATLELGAYHAGSAPRCLRSDSKQSDWRRLAARSREAVRRFCELEPGADSNGRRAELSRRSES